MSQTNYLMCPEIYCVKQNYYSLVQLFLVDMLRPYGAALCIIFYSAISWREQVTFRWEDDWCPVCIGPSRPAGFHSPNWNNNPWVDVSDKCNPEPTRLYSSTFLHKVTNVLGVPWYHHIDHLWHIVCTLYPRVSFCFSPFYVERAWQTRKKGAEIKNNNTLGGGGNAITRCTSYTINLFLNILRFLFRNFL